MFDGLVACGQSWWLLIELFVSANLMMVVETEFGFCIAVAVLVKT